MHSLCSSQKIPLPNFKIVKFSYDPNRTAILALLEQQETKILSYVLRTNEIKIGDIIISTKETEMFSNYFISKDGYCVKLNSIIIGNFIHNVEIQPNCGFKIARSAGTFAQIISKQK